MSDRPKSPYIVGRAYDWAFFLLPPVLSLLIGIDISGTDFSERTFWFAGREFTAAEMMIGIIIQAHLVAVLFRSHGNATVRRRHPLRFFLVPLALWIAIASSMKIAFAATVVATLWDVYHSGAQTFGFARIYDRNYGNPPDKGRRLDFWVSQLLYAGPILAGVSLMDHVKHLDEFEDIGIVLFSNAPAFVESNQRYVAWTVIAGGSVFLLFYVGYYVRLHLSGYRVSPLKIFLVTTTGACSIYTWGLNSWGEAFFIMNLFHAVQYLALVWHAERGTMTTAFRMGARRRGKTLTCVLYLGAVLSYGFVSELLDGRLHVLWSITIVVSLLHFWYDGFVWSVKRQDV
jgi:hypothetical protein